MIENHSSCIRVSDVKNYDVNANMKTLPDKGITQPIAYNFLNLPQNIIQNSNSTNYLYRADGTKVSKAFIIYKLIYPTEDMEIIIRNLV